MLNERKIRLDLSRSGTERVSAALSRGAYNYDPGVRKIVMAWLSEQHLSVKDSRETESLSAAKEANLIAKDSNLLSLEANRLASRAHTTARIAIAVAAAALFIEAWPYIKLLLETFSEHVGFRLDDQSIGPEKTSDKSMQ